MHEALDLEIRRKIYDLIAKNPGLHAKKIAEMLIITGQLIDYHLLFMEREGLLTSVKEEGYRRYYIKGSIGIKERRRISILRQETPLKIVFFLLEHASSSHKEILAHVNISKSTLTYHLQKLIDHEIVSRVTSENETKYHILNAKEIIQLLIRYKPYSRIESFKDTWVDLRWPGSPKKHDKQ